MKVRTFPLWWDTTVTLLVSQYLYLLVKVRTPKAFRPSGVTRGSVAIPIPSGEGQNMGLSHDGQTVSREVVAIPIPSGEGQNHTTHPHSRPHSRPSQYLYLLVKVRTSCGVMSERLYNRLLDVAIPIPSGEGQNLPATVFQ